MTINPEHTLSVIVPLCDRIEPLAPLHREYKAACEGAFADLEFVYVIGSDRAQYVAEIKQLSDANPDITLVVLNRDYGEATAIKAAISHARGEHILVLPAYRQVVASDIKKLFSARNDADIALGHRWPRKDSQSNQLKSKFFNWLLFKFSDQQYRDIGCSVRLFKKAVLKELDMYGDQYRFVPLMAHQAGFTLTEIELRQAEEDMYARKFSPGIVVRRFLDLLSIVFLTKFNKKPLRFFGLFGAGSILLGTLGLLYLTIDRLALDTAMSDRPMLILFTLFFVLGFQLIAIGLVGETVIFALAGEKKEYRIRQVIEQRIARATHRPQEPGTPPHMAQRSAS